MLAEIEALLSKYIEPVLVRELLKEYQDMRKAHITGDWPGVLNHSGMFCQAGITILNQISTGDVVDVTQVEFGKLHDVLVRLPKTNPESELTTLAIPHVMRSVHDVRSKKRVTHIKAFDPNHIDAEYVMQACSWCLATLMLLLDKTQKPEEVGKLVEDVIKKQIPLIEEFEDGGLVVLEKLAFRDELLLALYKKNSRLSSGKLATILSTYPQNVNTALVSMSEEKLVHRNSEGAKITAKGIATAESIINAAKK